MTSNPTAPSLSRRRFLGAAGVASAAGLVGIAPGARAEKAAPDPLITEPLDELGDGAS